MTNCHYCGKKLPMLGGRRFPAHPKDVGFDDTAFSCEECWRTRVAGIGLTVATGDKKADVARIKQYYQNALSFKESGDILSALDNYEKYVELSLKCLGYKRDPISGSGWVSGYDLDSMGDLYAAAGNIEKARDSYQLALKLLKGAAKNLTPTPLGAIAYSMGEGLRKAYIGTIEGKLGKLPYMPPTPIQRRYCMYCGASIPLDAAYCIQCGKQQ